ncbi:hypothetical protein EMIHUDRAFT_221497 [Emiliania huxleyi CCMP1516]|uniref:glutathione gamma-glutamylcysteinyltransferase n=2 Tax=Emiliania huxleyi TaxID=2903 RepID=A0A0D3HYI4_EMIH1|nr:hypothetical protein EMIHUDRAFT_221497 [Emiliania huxleyi CCMP1516]EOD04069.1 hypothetical protein EMIHUDRAFT_221497 [Emiliania huxleyi CCMP1516]|eukprot:XP_005756498.1 hypothetical protein EMIHUDRAFT_221497 [Emiliania huxleyi CCMP1516]
MHTVSLLTPPPPLRALRRQYALLASRKSPGTARPRLSRDAAVQPSPQHAVVQPSPGSVRSASELSSASQCERVERERLPPKSVFRRQLPAPLVAFSSPQGRRNFAEAMAAGQLEPYFPLSEQFVTQDEPTFCGLTTLTMVLNALNIDPRRRWRDEAGPGWRWWSDEMLPASCTVPLEQVRAEGTTMDDFARLAVANGARVRTRYACGESLDSFRASLVERTTSAAATFAVTSFCRARLGQTGGGHFSPIGGYHAESDSALVLDVARFKYPPFWVPVEQLWEATLAVDEVTGRARGWFELSAAPLNERRRG